MEDSDTRRFERSFLHRISASALISIAGEFQRGRKTLSVSPQGPLIYDECDLVILALLDGVVLGTSMEKSVKYLEEGLTFGGSKGAGDHPSLAITSVTPSRRDQPPALAALV